jgi:predicted DCC family thiol-disulfide oxidoreductase YuxK
VTEDADAGERPFAWVILYDGECGLCKWLLSLLLRCDGAGQLRPVALQQSGVDELLSELTPAERMASWHLISPAGERHSADAAVAPLLRLLPGGRLPGAGLARIPSLTERGYWWVAEHRSQLSKWVPSRAKRRAGDRVRQREQAAAAARGAGLVR